MSALTIEINDEASPALSALTKRLNSEELREAIGEGVKLSLFDHFMQLNSQPNKQGFPKTGFFAKAAESLSSEVDNEGVSVSVTQVGIRQRLLGGQILPTGGRKYLTIPANSLTYGRRAAEFTDSKFAFQRDENGYLRPCLIASDTTTITGAKRSRKGAKMTPFQEKDVLFWLVKEVNQQPDPTVIPDDETILDAAIDAAKEYISAVTSTHHDSETREA